MSSHHAPLRVFRVAPEEVEVVWPAVEPLLEKALAYNRCIDADDVLGYLKSGAMQLLVVVDDTGKIVAALATEIVAYPKLKCLRIVLAGGEALLDWRDEMHDLIESGARAAGCTVMEIVGRAGWVRRLRNYGYTETFLTLQRPIGPPEA